MSVVFVGAFNPITREMSDSSSGAGAKVQQEIIRAISVNSPELKSLVMQEIRTWPYNDFYIKGKHLQAIDFLPMVNFFFIKKLFFSMYVFMYLLVTNPDKVYFYNTNACTTLFMFILGFFRRKQTKILIIQDLHAPRKLVLNKLYRLDKVFEFLFAKLIKLSFSYFVPITKQLGSHLNLPEDYCFPFLGGVTDDMAEIDCSNVRQGAVFAGALEKYNGVDYLLDAWVRLGTSMELHIFGSGTLSETVAALSKEHKNIIFHGFQSPLVVKTYIRCAKINICLRYSRGIEEEFFFPSKFFDVFTNRGLVVCNRFKNIPGELENYIYYVNDDFSNLDSLIKGCDTYPSFYDQRVELVRKNFSWCSIIDKIDQVLGVLK